MSTPISSFAKHKKCFFKSWEKHQITATFHALPVLLGGIVSTCYCLGRKRLEKLTITNLSLSIFLFTPVSVPLLTVALSISLIGLIIFGTRFQKLTEGLHTLLLVTTLMNAGISLLIHESGHAVLAALLFRKAEPKIQIFPFQGGTTSYTVSFGLTLTGQWIGQDLADTLVTAGGFAASCAFIQVASILPKKISLPVNIQRLFKFAALSQLFFEVIYATKAWLIDQKKLENDFTKLWITQGIHPVVPIAINTLMLLQTQLFPKP